MTTDKSSMDVQLQGLYSVYLWCLKLNYMKEAKWCDEALKHMRELREENAKFRQEKQINIPSDKPEQTFIVHGIDETEYENLIRQSERQRCATIVRSFFLSPWFLNEDGKGYKDEERARVENEKIERIALAVEKG